MKNGNCTRQRRRKGKRQLNLKGERQLQLQLQLEGNQQLQLQPQLKGEWQGLRRRAVAEAIRCAVRSFALQHEADKPINEPWLGEVHQVALFEARELEIGE